jgi:hypothetical protein
MAGIFGSPHSWFSRADTLLRACLSYFVFARICQKASVNCNLAERTVELSKRSGVLGLYLCPCLPITITLSCNEETIREMRSIRHLSYSNTVMVGKTLTDSAAAQTGSQLVRIRPLPRETTCAASARGVAGRLGLILDKACSCRMIFISKRRDHGSRHP